MKNKWFWIIGILGLGGFYLLSRRSLAKNLIFNLSNINFKGSVLKPIIQVSFTVQNPTNQKATLKGLAGTLLFNGNQVSNISNFIEQTIQARGESIINIDVRPSIIGISQTIIDLLRNNKRTGKFTFDGSANVDGIVIPINQTYDL